MEPITTTLKAIRKHSPCEDSWKKLLNSLGKTRADNEPLKFSTILESNGIDDALWCLRSLPEIYHSEIRHLAADYADSVLHIFEAQCPEDKRPRLAIQTARRFANGEIDAAALATARATARATAGDAAWAAVRATALAAAGTARAAARAAAWAAAGDTTRDAALAAAGAASGAAAWGAARATVGDAAWAAVEDATRDAALAAAWAAAGAAERKIQEELLIKYFR